MSGRDVQGRPAEGARERDRCLAALDAGTDAYLAEPLADEQHACLRQSMASRPDRLVLVLVPDLTCPLCGMSRGDEEGIIFVAPDMSEAARRDLGVALRDNAVRALFVTPERLDQPRFVQFIRGQRPSVLVVASAQRLVRGRADFFAPYESLRGLRGHFPEVPVLVLCDGPQSEHDARAIGAALGLRLSEAPAGAAALPPASRGADASSSIPGALRALFPLFDGELSIDDIARQSGRDRALVGKALAAYIRHTGRAHPFPWVDKPTYMKVAVVAGQAETTSPKLILSLLKDEVEEAHVLAVLAALDNRRPGAQG